MRQLSIVLFLLCFFWSSGYSQERVYRQYFTQKVDRRLQRQHPEIRKKRRNYEQYIRAFRFSGRQKPINIPVVIHVLYGPGQNYPDVNMILDQLDQLNQDFNKANLREQLHPSDAHEGYYRRSADLAISFCLAGETPSGGRTTGVNYVYTQVNEWGVDDKIKFGTEDGADPWNPERYLNIWVGHLIAPVSGYAQMPGGPIRTDGIVIDETFFGVYDSLSRDRSFNPYFKGKTLSHLVGSYLGLQELWNEYLPCSDDYVNDTPLHNAPNYGNPGLGHVSLCMDHPIEMVTNIMDSADDTLMHLFTHGQKARIQAVLSEHGPRGGLGHITTRCNELLDLTEAVEELLEIKESPKKVAQIDLFPNPTNGQTTLTIHTPEQVKGQITIFNSLGSIQFRQEYALFAGQQQFSLPTENWNQGMYIIHAKIGQEILSRRLLIIKR